MAATDTTDDIATPRRVLLLVVGVLLLQLAFIGSYVGAFHDPVPHRLDVGVVAPDAVADQIVDQLDSLDGHPVRTHVVTEAQARSQVADGSLVAAMLVDTSSSGDTLLVASGGGTSLVSAAEEVAGQVEQAQQRTFTVTDVVPLASGDARGLSGFYLVVGWTVGGYLVASLLGVTIGHRPGSLRSAGRRLAAMVPYAALSGLGGALVVGPWLDALPSGHVWTLAGIGTLVVLGAAATTMALQALFGTIGIAIAIVVFVVLGNPSAGGAFQTEMLPGLWRTIGPWLPNGAAVSAVRDVVYLGGGIATQVWVLIGWVVVAAAVMLAVAARRAVSSRVGGEHDTKGTLS